MSNRMMVAVIAWLAMFGSAFADVLVPVKVSEAKVRGHVQEIQDRFLQNRVLSEYARKEIWKEARDAFAHPDDDVFNKPAGMWKGEFWGKLMISASRVAEYTGDEDLKRFLREEAHRLIAFQRPDGYLGTYVNAEWVTPPDTNETSRVIGWPCDWNWNLWCRKYTLWGLLSCYRLTGDKAILAAADRAMSQQITMLRRLGLRLADTGTGCMHGLPPCSVLKPLLWLHADTGRVKYLDYAREIYGCWNDPTCLAPQFAAKLATGKPIQDWYPATNGRWGKAYEMMSCFAGVVEYYRATGDRSALEMVRGMRDRIYADELNLCLSVGYNDQFWGSGRHLNGVSEPCDAIHWMRLNHELWRVTGEAKYVDSIEETFYNAFLAAIRPDGKWGARCVRSHGRHQPAPPQSGMRLQHCCVNNMPRGFMDAVQTLAAKDAAGVLHVAMYHDAVIDAGGDRIEVSGGFPVSGEVSVRFKRTAAGPVRFRVPKWCPALAIRSKGVDLRATVPGWFEVTVPAGGSEWRLSFDMNPRIVGSNRKPVSAYDPTKPLVTRWARNSDGDLGERDLMPLLFKEPRAQIMWGPMLLARSIRLGATREQMLGETTVNGGDWRLKLTPASVREGVWGVWDATLERAGEQRRMTLCDYSSAAVWTKDQIEFCVLF